MAVILGLMLFMEGLKVGLMPLGETLGSSLPVKSTLPVVLLITCLLGIGVTVWAYWQRPASLNALNQSIFADITSVMNIGIVLGALYASSLAGKFAPSFKLPWRSLLAAVIGGLLMDYGARIAYGCNIGAYFGGISSTSLHGWLWFVAAFVGSTLGTRLRPYFGMKL